MSWVKRHDPSKLNWLLSPRFKRLPHSLRSILDFAPCRRQRESLARHVLFGAARLDCRDLVLVPVYASSPRTSTSILSSFASANAAGLAATLCCPSLLIQAWGPIDLWIRVLAPPFRCLELIIESAIADCVRSRLFSLSMMPCLLKLRICDLLDQRASIEIPGY